MTQLASQFGSIFAYRAAGQVISAVVNPLSRSLDQLANDQWPNLSVPPEDAIRAFHCGRITNDQLTALLRMHGIAYGGSVMTTTANSAAWTAYVDLQKPTLDAALMRTAYFLGICSQQQFTNVLSRLGITDVQVQEFYRRAGVAVLPVGEVIGAAAQQSWSDAIASRWGYDNERPPELDLWMQRLGLNYDGTAQQIGNIVPNTPTAAQVLWRNHWKTFDLTTLDEVMRRVRGNPDDETSWSIPGLAPLRESDITDIMKANAVPTAARPYFRELFFRPISIRQLQNLVLYEKVDRARALSILLDNGYKQADAEMLRDTVFMQVDTIKQRPVIGLKAEYWKRLIVATVKAYEVGTLDKGAAANYLLANGVPVLIADIIVNQAEIALQTAVVVSVTRRARADWFAGRTSLAGAGQRLTSAGMTPTRVTQTLQTWQIERGEGRVVLATDKVLKLLRTGYISANEAAIRLDNLGWAVPDKLLLLAEVAGEQAQDAARAQRAADMAASKQAAEMARLVKANAAQLAKLQAHAQRLRPAAKVLRWLKRGLWTQAQTEQWLAVLGYDAGTIQTLIAEAMLEEKGGPDTLTAAADKVAAEMRRLTPAAKVVKWAKDKVWTRAQAEQRLALLGYPPDIIATMLDDAKVK